MNDLYFTIIFKLQVVVGAAEREADFVEVEGVVGLLEEGAEVGVVLREVVAAEEEGVLLVVAVVAAVAVEE